MKRLLTVILTGVVVLALAATVTAITVSGGNSPGAASARPAAVDADAGQTPDTPEQYVDLKEGSDHSVSVAQVARARAQAAADPAAPGTDWQFVGPTNVGGRVIDMVVDTDIPAVNGHDVVFVATSGGGIWKSADQGITWTPAWPSTYTQTMGAIAPAPTRAAGTLWAGTGEANPSGGGLTFTGTGFYKSTDDGNTWTYSSLNDSAAIGRIAVNPNNPNEALGGGVGLDLRSAGYTQTGLYHTTDGGQTWTRSIVAGQLDDRRDRHRRRPSNPNIVWARCGITSATTAPTCTAASARASTARPTTAPPGRG